MPDLHKFVFLEATHAPSATTSISIDEVDACNLACVTCARGRLGMKNRRGQMPLELFEKVVSKAASFGFSHICLYNWTEPFLCQNLQDYTKIIKEYGLFCQLSSNLSFRRIPHLLPTLKNCDRLIVSLSGFSQAVYRINHRGGNIELVKKQLEIIGEAKRLGHIQTEVDIRYFISPYTESEYEKFRQFGEALGFNVLAWQGLGDPLDANNSKMVPVHSPGAAPATLPPYPRDTRYPRQICYTSIAPFNVDFLGGSSLCCCMPNTPATKIGSFLDDSFESQLFRRVTHTLCSGCAKMNPVAPVGHT